MCVSRYQYVNVPSFEIRSAVIVIMHVICVIFPSYGLPDTHVCAEVALLVFKLERDVY